MARNSYKIERGEIFMGQKLKQSNDISIVDNVHKLRNATNLTQKQILAQLQLRKFSIQISTLFSTDWHTANNHRQQVFFCCL